MITSSSPAPSSFQEINQQLREEGFTFLPADQTSVILDQNGSSDWDHFTKSWNDLGTDRYMADGGRYRRRRYATFSLNEKKITRKAPQPHYQSRDYNLLNGGIERWFSPIKDEICTHPAMQAVLKMASSMASALSSQPPSSWHAEVHQFRIETKEGTSGCPTPEGMHQDGVDWVFVFMIQRENVREGMTSIHALDQKTKLGSFTLIHPRDAAIVDDHRVYHGVTAIEPQDPNKPAYRDVLVVTLRYE